MSGSLYIVAAPSGAGKSTLVNALLERERGIELSISHTTRPPRPGEADGEHYHFCTLAEFERLVEHDELLEHALVHGNRYGTARSAVEPRLAAGPRRALRARRSSQASRRAATCCSRSTTRARARCGAPCPKPSASSSCPRRARSWN